MAGMLRILLLEDSTIDAELIEAQLENLQETFEVNRVATRAAYQAALAQHTFEIILSDFSLPDFDGMAALDLAVASAPDAPFIFVSGVLGEDAAIEAFRKGATDYVLKQRLARLPAAVTRAVNEARERAERRRIEQQKDLLVRELSHRVKNNLAVVLSLIRRTGRGCRSVAEFEEKLIARVSALADAHELLFEGNWDETELLSVFQRAVRPHNKDLSRFDIGRHDLVRLDPRTALSIGMVFNELVTNASKYGALANEQGRVSIAWVVNKTGPGRSVRINWTERGGPVVKAPDDEGFGTRLIKANIEYELGGQASLHYLPDGFRAEIDLPIAESEALRAVSA
ncbi:HWE histidine kinase domain-containing protein [Shinella kummerowiae]|jgi:two-component sensor histidine kinase|nr:HWE histidine kinase domain-containing protein [Shinella kummerowiae]MCT7668167.1 response regulator [Shinella kummerowiae]